MTQLFRPVQIPPGTTTRPVNGTNFGKDPMFNFATGEFYLDSSGDPIHADQSTAMANLVQKAIYTPRNRYLIFTQAYGSDILNLLDKNRTRDELLVEMRIAIREALIYDPRIINVNVTNIELQSDNVLIEFTYTDIWSNIENVKLVF
jgi:phage baseplate assembly protein W